MNYPVKGRSGELSKGADAGISIGSVAAAALGVAALFWCYFRRKPPQEEEEEERNQYSGRGQSPQDQVSSLSTGRGPAVEP